MTGPLDLVQARRNAAKGVRQVEGAADAGWMDRAYTVVLRLAEREEFFHPDDIWAALGDDVPEEARALGAVMRRIQRDGVATATDWARRSQLKNCNMHWRPIWKSRIYKKPARKKTTQTPPGKAE